MNVTDVNREKIERDVKVLVRVGIRGRAILPGDFYGPFFYGRRLLRGCYRSYYNDFFSKF